MQEILIDDTRCFIRAKKLPTSVHAFTVMDIEGNANIYVNSVLTQEQQQEALDHELGHIHYGDAYNDLPIEEAESF